MVDSPKVGLLRESGRFIKEGDLESFADIWRHEGLKKLFETGLYYAGKHDLGRLAIGHLFGIEDADPRLVTNVGGLELQRPGGVTAGWDKPGKTILGWQSLGAGFMIPGAVTMYRQYGNPMVRLHTFDRQLGDHGKNVSRNSLGFNSLGSEEFVYNICRQREMGDVTIPIIAQITLNKEMYEPANRHMIPGMIAATVKKVMPVADAIELGLTSPNTLGMRDAQDAEEFTYANVMAANETIDGSMPLSFKGDGDGGEERLEMYCRLVERTGLGILSLINSTALERIKVKYMAADMPGGLAGSDPEYQQLALDSVRYLYEGVGDKVDIIGMGGVDSADQAVRMFKAGASAIGVNTAIRKLGLRTMRVINGGLSVHREVQAVDLLDQLIGSGTSRGPKYLAR